LFAPQPSSRSTPKDYKTAPTADQMTQLKAVFADGVCDWSKPGGEIGRAHV